MIFCLDLTPEDCQILLLETPSNNRVFYKCETSSS